MHSNMNNNPYSPPESAVDDVIATDNGAFIPTGRSVSFLSGAKWIDQGIKLVLRQPKTWLMIIAIYCLIGLISEFLLKPFGTPTGITILSLVMFIVETLLFAGMICVAESQRSTGKANFSLFGNGFVNRTGGIIGVIVIQYLVIIIGFIGAFAFVGFSLLPYIEQLVYAIDNNDENVIFNIFENIGAGKIICAVCLLFLTIIISQMLTCFAIPLIVINQLSVGQAISASFSGSLKNILPAFAYSVSMGIFAGILGLISAYILPFENSLTLLAGITQIPVWYLAIYAAYRNIFTYSDAL